MKKDQENYARGAELTYRLVQAWDGEPPRFAFPPREIERGHVPHRLKEETPE